MMYVTLELTRAVVIVVIVIASKPDKTVHNVSVAENNHGQEEGKRSDAVQERYASFCTRPTTVSGENAR